MAVTLPRMQPMTDAQIAEANLQLRDRTPQEIVRWAIDQAGGRAIVSTNFRPYEAVILHLATQVQPDIPVLWVDHGYNRPATYLHAEALRALLNLNLQAYLPRLTPAHYDAVHGGMPEPTPENEERIKAFSKAMKLEPFQRARERAKPEGLARTMKSLHRLALHTRQRVLPKSALGKACDYLLSQWGPLSAHLHHGESRLDNNLVENAIRPSCIGKKNWLFIGHPDAGQRSAILYSLVVSCQRHGKDPFAYLRDVLSRLPALTNQDDLTALTPAHWQPARA